jgi:hypothetical protein
MIALLDKAVAVRLGRGNASRPDRAVSTPEDPTPPGTLIGQQPQAELPTLFLGLVEPATQIIHHFA